MEHNIVIAIITALAGFLTSIVASFRTYVQSKKLEQFKSVSSKEMENLKNEQLKEITFLKNELEIQKENDNIKFKFLLNYETEKVNQYLLNLKEFLTSSQKIKDEVRAIIENSENHFTSEVNARVEILRSRINENYANGMYYFRSSIPDNAHQIKALFFKIFHEVQKPTANSEKIILDIIIEISEKQNLLQRQINIEIDKIFNNVTGYKNQSSYEQKLLRN